MLYDIRWFGAAEDDWVFTRQLGMLVPGDISGVVRVGVCEGTGDEDTRQDRVTFSPTRGRAGSRLMDTLVGGAGEDKTFRRIQAC